MLTDLLTDDVTIFPAGETAEADDFAPAAPSPEPEGGVTVKGALQQRSSGETSDGEVSRTEWVLFLAPDATIDTANTVEIDGKRFQVDGDPWPVKDHPRGSVHHLEVGLERIGKA